MRLIIMQEYKGWVRRELIWILVANKEIEKIWSGWNSNKNR